MGVTRGSFTAKRYQFKKITLTDTFIIFIRDEKDTKTAFLIPKNTTSTSIRFTLDSPPPPPSGYNLPHYYQLIFDLNSRIQLYIGFK